MRSFLFFLLLTAAVPAQDIRVALTVDARQVELNSAGWKDHPDWGGSVIARASSGGIEVGGRTWPSPLQLEPVGRRFRFNGKRHAGKLHLRKAGDRVVLVNHLPLETYLSGVLVGEISPDWPRSTLQAHTIASRTYAAYMRTTPRGPDYDVASTVLDQVYAGQDGVSGWLQNLVGSTAGQLLVQSDGKPIKAYYSSHCGGQTSPSGLVFGPDVPALRSVKDPYCAGYPNSTWTVTLGPASLKKAALSKQLGWPLARISVEGYDESGRLAHVALQDRAGKTARLTGHEFRMAVGPRDLPSTRCRPVSESSSQMVLRGGGWGHGVGLCQWGSHEMGKRGMTARQILQHYYPTCSLRVLRR